MSDDFEYLPKKIEKLEKDIAALLENQKVLKEAFVVLNKKLDNFKSNISGHLYDQVNSDDNSGNLYVTSRHDLNITATTGRVHINGSDRLFLLNKEGVIVGKEWGGTGNLSVQGEIRGCLPRSKEFSLDLPKKGGPQRERMWHSHFSFPVITSICGNFCGAGERVWVEVGDDDHWYLCGHSYQDDVKVKAICVGKSPIDWEKNGTKDGYEYHNS